MTIQCLLLLSTMFCSDIVPKSEGLIIREAVERNISKKNQHLKKDFVKLLKAIRRTENGREGFEFGVEHKNAKGIINQAGWCASIVQKRFDEYKDNDEPFLWYLATRYCPVNRDVWFKTVVYFIEEMEK